MMTKFKWLSVLVCLSLVLGLQTHVNANAKPQTQTPRDPDILQRMITGDPAEYYLPQPQPTGQLAPQVLPVYLPPGWTRLAFQSMRYDNWDIYLTHPSGAGEVHLVDNAAADGFPSLAKGGERVAFASNRSGNNDIYLQNADGSGLAALVATPANETYPVWSPDNQRVAFQSDAAGNFDIYVAGPAGIVQLTQNSFYDGEPTWSPDGTQIAFISNRGGNGYNQLWVMNADGSNPRQLTTINTQTATPAWSPLGDKIAYAADINTGNYALFLIDAEGTAPAKVIFSSSSEHDFWSPAWSPDGKWLAALETEWVFTTGWHWTSSSIIFVNASNGDYYRPFQDTLTMKVSWATTDVTAPEPCKITSQAYLGWESSFVTWSAFDAPAGVATYDVQVRDLPDGAWRDLLIDVPQIAGIYPGKSGQRFEFRCRGRDSARNFSGWEAMKPGALQIETGRPFSQVNALPRYVKGSQVTLNWQGSATAGYITRYDIFVRDGQQGNWTAWLRGTRATTAEFTGTPGHTYYFRSQAYDKAQHVQVWQPEAQAVVTLYSTLALRANDVRGNPLPVPNFTLVPPPVRDAGGQAPFEKRWDVASPVRIVTAVSGFGAVPDTTLNVNTDQNFAYVLPPADDQTTNGGFETGTLSGWTASGNGASVSGTVFHSGQSAARLVAGELAQEITVANTLQQPTFSFLYYVADNPGNAELSVEIVGAVSRSVLSTQALTSGWTPVWADLSDFAGQTVTLRFRLTGGAATVYLDDITLGSWKTPWVQTVTPGQWTARQAQTIEISGQNFAGTPQVFLNQVALSDIERLDAEHLRAKTPPDMLGGYYNLRVVNPDGIESVLPNRIALDPLPIYMPLVSKPGPPPVVSTPIPALPSDWMNLARDAQHSGYSPDQPVASRYGLTWSTRLANQPAQVFVADGVLIVTRPGYELPGGIFAYDVDSGTELWHFQIAAYTYPQPEIGAAAIANGAVYFLRKDEYRETFLYGLDLRTGQQLLRSRSYGVPTQFPPLVTEQKAYVANGSILVHDASSGVQLSYLTELYGYGSQQLAYADGKIYSWKAYYDYYMTRGTFFFSEHDSSDGKVNWTLELPLNSTLQFISMAPVISGRTAFVAHSDFLMAIDLDTHSSRWSAPGDYSMYPPAVAGDTIYALNAGKLEARRISTGELTGSFSAPAKLIYSPIVTKSEIYVSNDSAAYVLDLATLKVKWTAPTGGRLIIANGYLILSHPDGTISVYRAQEP